ncbi:hypothetical protein CAAN1_01S07954 [[Candida] anglica]|uniref:Uncharacterized protein n=1 Tax=[Candida] anglica TaxID=148631 RepID=A0ABP0EKB5_9ASCO
MKRTKLKLSCIYAVQPPYCSSIVWEIFLLPVHNSRWDYEHVCNKIRVCGYFFTPCATNNSIETVPYSTKTSLK